MLQVGITKMHMAFSISCALSNASNYIAFVGQFRSTGNNYLHEVTVHTFKDGQTIFLKGH